MDAKQVILFMCPSNIRDSQGIRRTHRNSHRQHPPPPSANQRSPQQRLLQPPTGITHSTGANASTSSSRQADDTQMFTYSALVWNHFEYNWLIVEIGEVQALQSNVCAHHMKPSAILHDRYFN